MRWSGNVRKAEKKGLEVPGGHLNLWQWADGYAGCSAAVLLTGGFDFRGSSRLTTKRERESEREEGEEEEEAKREGGR